MNLVKIFKCGSTKRLEKRINRFAKKHYIIQVSYIIDDTNMYSCMALYREGYDEE